MIRSLRSRLLVRMVLGASVLLGVGGVLLIRSVEGRARRDFDRALEDRARALSSLAEQENERVWLEFDPVAFPEFFPGTTADYFELRDEDGATLLVSASSAGRSLPLRGLAAGEANPRLVDLQLFDGRPGRAVVYGFSPRLESDEKNAAVDPDAARLRATSAARAAAVAAGGRAPKRATVLVARERGSLDRFVARVRSKVLTFSIGLVVALSALMFWAVHREMARVRLLAERVAKVDAGSLGTPIGSVELPTELRPIASRLDELLARLHVSFERERQFSSQLAHELRTPLAEMRSTVEVALRWPESESQLAEALREVGQIGGQMERVLRNLLEIARADAGIEPFRAANVPLAAAVDEAAEGVAKTLARRKIELRNAIEPEVAVVAPIAALDLILGNLLANAAEYATEGSWVECAYFPREWRLSLRNPAADLDVDDGPRLFERFWRKSAGRDFGEHSGLGLSLVRALARRMGGDASAQVSGGILSVDVTGLRLAGPGSGGREATEGETLAAAPPEVPVVQ